MKHIDTFHGAVTALLTKQGLDSKKVLDACNAWRGSIKAMDEETKSQVTLSGRVNKDGTDKRRLSAKDTVVSKAKDIGYTAPGALVALSDALRKMTETHGATVVLTEFPEGIEEWLDRNTFKTASEVKAEPAKDHIAKEGNKHVFVAANGETGEVSIEESENIGE